MMLEDFDDVGRDTDIVERVTGVEQKKTLMLLRSKALNGSIHWHCRGGAEVVGESTDIDRRRL